MCVEHQLQQVERTLSIAVAIAQTARPRACRRQCRPRRPGQPAAASPREPESKSRAANPKSAAASAASPPAQTAMNATLDHLVKHLGNARSGPRTPPASASQCCAGRTSSGSRRRSVRINLLVLLGETSPNRSSCASVSPNVNPKVSCAKRQPSKHSSMAAIVSRNVNPNPIIEGRTSRTASRRRK